LIDRSRSLAFTFDGRRYHGHPGDTLASALLANGVHLVGRSFKYHRPRGILSAGSEEPNALVELRTGARREPNTRATTAELYDGLAAYSQNRWPSLGFDVLAVNSTIAPFLAAGFYYKTFMWPASFWEKVYEPLIRRAAGLGRAAGREDPDRYEKAFLHCDVLVVGSGPAGLMAALAAGRAGARVVLCEEDFRLGGRLIADSRVVADRPSAEWSAAIVEELAALPSVRVMARTTVVGVYDGGTYAALERVNDHMAEPPPFEPRQRLWRIVATRAILAAGALERPLAFGDNDRFRLSFSGELAYEIAVPAGYGDALIRRIMEAGRAHGIVPYGTEALGAMRIEKGHLGGGELNGQTTARDLGLGRMLSARKDYIGRVLAQRPALVDPGRPALVGIRPVERGARLRAGAHFIAEGAEAAARNDEGHVTSVAFSPSLGHWIGLGLLARGPQRHGERVRAYDPVRGGDTPVEVCDPVFIDPQGERLRG
jgi:NADPH-dependent 2,4-dienoyl-CoA reductase/sulfur reductase-like enzyme